MTPAPPLSQDVWDATPPEARAFIAAVLLQVEALRAEVATLKARLDANSQVTVHGVTLLRRAA